MSVTTPAKTRRPKAPSANFFFRWIFPALLVGLAFSVVNLAFRAKDLVLESRDGNIVRTVDDPESPGFFAEVIPTPTLLIVHAATSGELVSVAVMSLTSGEDGGGSMLMLPNDLVVPLRSGGHEVLSRLYGDGDLPTLQAAVEYLIGSGVDSTAIIGSDTLEALVAPVAPLEYTLFDNVRERDGDRTVTILAKGDVTISTSEDIRAATEVLGPGEASVNLVQRQVAFWTAWLDAINDAPDGATVLPDLDAPLVTFVGKVGSGTSRVVPVRFEETVYDGLTLLVADLEGVRLDVLNMIPYPQMAAPGDRLLTEIRNVVGKSTLNVPMSQAVVAAGGQVAVISNADVFEPIDSTVIYYDAADRERVETLADELEIARDHVVFSERPGSSLDVTVTIGADYVP